MDKASNRAAWDDLYVKACKECETEYDEDGSEKDRIAFFDFLGDAFIWDETPEGHDFWNYVYERVQDITDMSKPCNKRRSKR